MRSGLPIGLATFLILAYGKIDQLLVFEIAGERDAGLYGAVYRVLSQGTYLPFAIITTLFPIMAATQAAGRERLQGLLQDAFDYLAIASFPWLPITLVAATPIVRLLFGAEFEDAASALPILMGAFIPISFWYVTSRAMLAMDLQATLARYAVLGLVVNVVLNLLLIPPYGFLAAAWVTVGTELLALALTFGAVRRETALRVSLKRIARTAVAAVLLGFALWLVESLGAGLGLILAAAAVVYPTLLLSLRALTPAQVRHLFRGEQAA
jgi:O-antigen/teichoic acid export membrane protein